MRLMSDLLPALIAADGVLSSFDLRWWHESALVVVMAKGYPGVYEKGTVIGGLDARERRPAVFHAGTNGAETARSRPTAAACSASPPWARPPPRPRPGPPDRHRIHRPDGACRRDIGWRALKR